MLVNVGNYYTNKPIENILHPQVTFCLEVVIASKSPVREIFQNFLWQTTTTMTTDGQNRLLNPACAYARGVLIGLVPR